MIQRRHIPLQLLMPTTGLLPYYVSEARKLTRAPEVYHLASIVTLLGAVLDPVACAYLTWDNGLSRRERLFLWTLLIGPAGNKKTYSSELALLAVLPHVEKRHRSGEGGRRALEDMLIHEPNPVLHVTEAASWFANNRQAGSMEGASFWTQVYDGYYMPRNRADSGDDASARIRVGVTLLLMGPDEEIIRTTRRSDWMGGLIPRLNICRAGRIKRGPGGAEWPPEILNRIRKAVDRIHGLAEKAQYLVLTKQARVTWERWQAKHDRMMETVSELHENIGSRVPWHVLRIAAIYAASRMSTVVERRDVVAACNFGRFLRGCSLSMEPKS